MIAEQAMVVATHGPFELTEVGVVETRAPTFEEWQEALTWCRAVERLSPFWIGDLLRLGEDRFGEASSQALDGHAPETLANYKYVAENVPPSRRVTTLPFSHHQEVAPLPPAEQAQWLQRCQEEQWTRAELRSQLRAAKAASGAPVELWLMVRCVGLADAETLASQLRATGRTVRLA